MSDDAAAASRAAAAGSPEPRRAAPTTTTTTTTRDGRVVRLALDHDREEYLATIDGEVVAMVGYQATGDIVVFTHTGTEPTVQGQGVASALVRFALDDVQATPTASGAAHRKVIAVCPFVAGYLSRHAEDYPDLDYRSRTRTVHD